QARYGTAANRPGSARQHGPSRRSWRRPATPGAALVGLEPWGGLDACPNVRKYAYRSAISHPTPSQTPCHASLVCEEACPVRIAISLTYPPDAPGCRHLYGGESLHDSAAT